MSTENKTAPREFDEISSAMAYEESVKNHPNKDVIPLIDWQYVHTWWRKGAQWQFNLLQSQLDEKTAEVTKLENIIRAEAIDTSELEERISEASHYTWLDDENAKLRAELEECKADKARIENLMVLEIRDATEPLLAENKRLREALTKIARFEYKHEIEGDGRIAREALKQEEPGEG